MENIRYASYVRVSTQRQGNSGLGLEAQRSAIKRLLNGVEIVQEFIDIESGTSKGNNRQGLQEALDFCRKNKVTLVFSKLDRLSRNVSFISQVLESEVDIVVCDMPSANRFTLHIFAALAEQEARYISERTKSALAELKSKGVKLGNPQNLTPEARNKGLEIRKRNARENDNNKKAFILIMKFREEGLSYQSIADKLNEYGYKTSRNCTFTKIQVSRIVSMLN